MADRDTPTFSLEAPCCDHWAAAKESGTDCELYGAAVRTHAFGAMICGMSAPVHFCPWCGAAKSPEAQAAREAA